MTVEARLWRALQAVEDPEIPVSVVGMGLIVSLAYLADTRAADEADPDVDAVDIEVVWDPVWTKDRIRADARATMRRLGIVA